MIRKSKFVRLLIVFIILTFIGGCIAAMSKPSEKENRLRYRVAKFHEDMKAGDYESNWDMFTSEDVMKRPDKDKFLMQSRTFPDSLVIGLKKLR